MKKTMIALAIAAVSFACTSAPQASVSDANATPAAECGVDCEKACCDAAAECSGEAKSECSGEAKAECEGEAKVCPVTGQEIN